MTNRRESVHAASFLEFLALVAEVPSEHLSLQADLEDLCFDSLAMVVAIAAVEEIAQASMPEDLITELRTAADLWAFASAHADPQQLAARLDAERRAFCSLADRPGL